MIHVMLQNEAKPVDQSTVELGSVAISGEVDTCSISTGDGWTEVTRVILRFQRESVAFLKEPGGNSRIPRNGIIISPLLGRNTTLVSEPTCQPSLLTTPFRFLDAFLQGQTTFKTESGNNF